MPHHKNCKCPAQGTASHIQAHHLNGDLITRADGRRRREARAAVSAQAGIKAALLLRDSISAKCYSAVIAIRTAEGYAWALRAWYKLHLCQ